MSNNFPFPCLLFYFFLKLKKEAIKKWVSGCNEFKIYEGDRASKLSNKLEIVHLKFLKSFKI